MGEKLLHLPTKATKVTPEGSKPFIRQQHFQPNKETGKGTSKGKKQEEPPKLQLLQKPENKLNRPNKEEPTVSESTPSLEDVLKPRSHYLNVAEGQMDKNLSDPMPLSQMEPIDDDNATAVQSFVGADNKSKYYQKPQSDEAINANYVPALRETVKSAYSGRDILAYDVSKLLGVEGLVPPTRRFSQMMGKDEWNGSAQMSAQQFARNVLSKFDTKTTIEHMAISGEGLNTMFEKSKNSTDLVMFDFITGNTDRHMKNIMISTDGGDDYSFIAIDHNLSFAEHRGDIIHPEWENTTQMWMNYYNSDAKNQPMSNKMLSKVLEFDEGSFRACADKHGIGKEGQDGMMTRISMIKEHMKQKYETLSKKYEKYSPEEREKRIKAELTFDGHDFENVVRSNIMTEIDANGEDKYGGKNLCEWYSKEDWFKELNATFKGKRE